MTFTDIQHKEKHISATIHIKADHPHFSGHFDAFPVLPAVSQLDYIVNLLEQSLGQRVAITNVTKGKFHNLIRPNTTCQISLRIDGNGLCNWVINSKDKLYSKGQICYSKH